MIVGNQSAETETSGARSIHTETAAENIPGEPTLDQTAEIMPKAILNVAAELIKTWMKRKKNKGALAMDTIDGSKKRISSSDLSRDRIPLQRSMKLLRESFYTKVKAMEC